MTIRAELGDAVDKNLGQTLRAISQDIRDEYLQPHETPWIIGFSGGKDSTLLAQLVFEVLLELAPRERRRTVHVVANDTLVESPVLARHLVAVLERMTKAVSPFESR